MKQLSTHPLQSLEWGEFRRKTGVKVIQGDRFQLTIHKIPHLPWTIGYLPKGPVPDKKMIEELAKIGKEEECIFIQLEPNAPEFTSEESFGHLRGGVAPAPHLGGESLKMLGLWPSFHPLFTQYTFILDLTKSEEELLKAMHPKTRYNIKVAQKHGVKIVKDNSDKAFETYLKLTKETTKRQKFYAHDEKYHRVMWNTLRCHPELVSGSRYSRIEMPKRVRHDNFNKLTAHLLLANYKPMTNDQRPKTLVAWILFVYKDTFYYPYGASASEHHETMASNLMMWEAIRFGKKLGLKKFDMWGSLGPNPDRNDPWYGFHRFKEGYGGELVELAGSYDLVINPLLYQFYKIADKARWLILKIKC